MEPARRRRPTRPPYFAADVESNGALRLARPELPPECDAWLIQLRVLAQRGLRGEPKVLFQYLWNLARCETGLVTVRLADIQASLGFSDTAARRHLKTLTSTRLLAGMDWPARGTVRVALADPAEALHSDPAPPPLRLLRGDPQQMLPGMGDAAPEVTPLPAPEAAPNGPAVPSPQWEPAGETPRASLRSLRSFIHSFIDEGKDTTNRETWLAAQTIAGDLRRGLWGDNARLKPMDRRLLLIVGYFCNGFLGEGFAREIIESTKLNRKRDCPVGRYVWGIMRKRLELNKDAMRNLVNRMPVPGELVQGPAPSREQPIDIAQLKAKSDANPCKPGLTEELKRRLRGQRGTGE